MRKRELAARIQCLENRVREMELNAKKEMLSMRYRVVSVENRINRAGIGYMVDEEELWLGNVVPEDGGRSEYVGGDCRFGDGRVGRVDVGADSEQEVPSE